MEKIKRSALIPYSAEKMFRLVDDIEQYPDFVPYCKSSQVMSREQSTVCAKLEVAKRGIAKSFTTRNTLTPDEKIRMELVDGPFKYLSGEWRFIALAEDACKIELELEFEFSNKLTSMAFASIFNQLIQSMVSAFTQRAEKVYG
ncbi:MAG: type II toxin-antitoxin system RatA family toxin [Kangiellaceae bacterium]|nr:type II toxin-antitoxin system RatA family toxin [Kangiellaceae bacterium]MCW8998654.1 type II toxin-antitoxin system RatA family toxin [Kangiellaceae bacterium]MCW9017259.1 type II toxin-antitoxin system RatA family toxin [Kangiellaceae bacterium]